MFEFFEAFLLLIERYFEINVLIEYHVGQNMRWFSLTLIFLWAPGVGICARSALNAIRDRKCIDWKDCIKYGVMYPVSSVIRYDSSVLTTLVLELQYVNALFFNRRFHVAFKGMWEGDYAIIDGYEKTLGIKSLQAFFENGPQVTLQMCIIILGWNDAERGGPQH